MKKLFTLCLLASTCITAMSQLVSYEKIDSLTITDLETIISNFGAGGLIIPQYPIDVYRVIYDTEYGNGMTQVSGALVVPVNPDCPVPLVSYQHGTTSNKMNVPSFGSSELNIAMIFASEGNVIVAPDYIGLGASTVEIHPYVHSHSQAHSTINLLRAARQINETDIDMNLSDQLFLFGYSQGGHATAAAVKYIETEYSDEFKVTASAPMSGPYDLAGAQTDYVNSGQPYATPGYLPFLVFGYQAVYGDLYDSIPQVFRAPYDTLLYPLFAAGNTGIGTINGLCDPIPPNMFTTEAEMLFNTDANYPLRVRLEENSLISWTPQSTMRMYYCTGDEQVYFRNSQIADSIWTLNGAPDVMGVQVGTGDHGDCVQPALMAGRFLFQGMLNFGIQIVASYNATTNEFETFVLNGEPSDYSVEWNNGTATSNIGNVQDGLTYTVTYTNISTGCSNSKSFTKEAVLGISSSNSELVMEVYPNPTSAMLNINTELRGSYELNIIDIAGKVVYSRSNIPVASIGINVSSLSEGVYNVVLSQNDKSVSRPFLKK